MRIGIDLGGTKIEGVVLDHDGHELLRKRVDTPQSDGYQAILHTVEQLVGHLEAEIDKKCSTGIGTPGAISAVTGTMKNSNTACLNGRTLLEDLQIVLDRPLRIGNDANCFTLSEALDGAGKGHSVVFGVIMGTAVWVGASYSMGNCIKASNISAVSGAIISWSLMGRIVTVATKAVLKR